MAGVHADLGQDAPGLEVGEPVLDGGAFAADQPVRFLLGIGESVVPGGPAAGDDHGGVVGLVVQADEAEAGGPSP
ncbi:hypothetical protein [Streptomyces sp. NPDC088766]|uniref:hypothetical protein n=1 Tax=Streptomyces sp. NPDC088766 TaxID=3365893 RepID=UPI00381EB764